MLGARRYHHSQAIGVQEIRLSFLRTFEARIEIPGPVYAFGLGE